MNEVRDFIITIILIVFLFGLGIACGILIPPEPGPADGIADLWIATVNAEQRLAEAETALRDALADLPKPVQKQIATDSIDPGTVPATELLGTEAKEKP